MKGGGEVKGMARDVKRGEGKKEGTGKAVK
jgi:hypothetical protein